MDWTYVTNIAHAHLLASDKLVDGNNNVAGQVIYFLICLCIYLLYLFIISIFLLFIGILYHK